MLHAIVIILGILTALAGLGSIFGELHDGRGTTTGAVLFVGGLAVALLASIDERLRFIHAAGAVRKKQDASGQAKQ